MTDENLAGGAGRPAQTTHPVLKFLREVAIILVIALVLSTLVRSFVMRSFYIPSSSMETTLAIGDRILVNQLPVPEVERGDIVVFDDPGGWLDPSLVAAYEPNPVLEFLGFVPSNAGSQLIKRVIGVGGDTVSCCDDQGRILVNGQPIEETYLDPGVAPSTVPFEVTVPAGHYWVMGDNRGNSLDSRYNMESSGGPYIPEENIVGTVFLINWPLDHFRWTGTPEDVFGVVPDSA